MVDEATLAIRALSVRVPEGERRNPIVMVRLAVGALVFQIGVSKLKKSGLTVRMPVGEGGVPAIEAAPEVWAVIQRTAIAAVLRDQVGREHLYGANLQHMDRATQKALRAAGVLPPPPSADVVPLQASAAPA
jgi:hypothetical protein